EERALKTRTERRGTRGTGGRGGGGGAKAWLSTILRNTWIDHLRSVGRHEDMGGRAVSVEQQDVDVQDLSGPETLADTGDPGALLEQFSDSQMIEALKSLPAEIRWTLLLVDVESLDHADA